VLHFKRGGKLGRVAKEFGGEVLSVIMGVLASETGSGTEGEVAETETETELGVQARKAAALTIGEAMVAAGRLAIGFDVRRQGCGSVR